MKRIGYLILLIVCLVLVLLAVFLLLFPTRKNAMVSTKQADKVVATEKSSTNDSSQNTEIIDLISTLNTKIINLTQQVGAINNEGTTTTTKPLYKKQFNLVAGQKSISLEGIKEVFEVEVEGIGLNPELDYTVDGSYLHLNIEPDTGDFLTIKYQ